jgi:acyl-CoA thioester hydrolase
MARPKPEARAAYPHFHEIATRWMDNDAYGHVNNAVHYSFFDTTVNAWLIARGALDVAASPVVGLVVETGCHYFASLAYPDPVTVGLRVAHLGRSSVRYELAIFAPGSATAAAQGHFVHVYVERASRRPVQRLPEDLRRALEPLVVSPAPHEPLKESP